MPTPSHDHFSPHVRMELLRGLRTWCTGLGVVVLALALMALTNTVSNPKTWTSAFNALAASGAFVQYAGWLAAVGGLFLLIALLVTFYLERLER
ncbi:MAG: hypothetical protein U1D69_08560 [Polynucleobacter sp.]|uniref:hypothetical protein n=1 Tax=Hydrogenophaga sp. TaxID=1904254 RepID=UPI00271CD17A|nr:hypothetical protein [Hydrogenophaga sp.]MDO9029912.1 hypothetical protein [Hydrogenophaga sp.]MDZ4057003.1 hypothetical protein [Polynucleobacter sp.]